VVTRSILDEHFYNADGGMRQQGRLRLASEVGRIDIKPGEIAVIPPGVNLRVDGFRLKKHFHSSRPDERLR
jgi:homogentisate 1,2-dioxygenase